MREKLFEGETDVETKTLKTPNTVYILSRICLKSCGTLCKMTARTLSLNFEQYIHEFEGLTDTKNHLMTLYWPPQWVTE